MTIEQAAAALRKGETTSARLTQEALAAAADSPLNAFITIAEGHAMERAKALDAELAAGHDRGPLHGLPIAHKDIIETRGIRTTSGSRIFSEAIPEVDADVVRRLNEAGGVMIGKLGLHEIAYGITSNNPHFGAVRNPWNHDCIPGGSSGGSGAAVSAGIVFMATGTDTGGSIRIPAAYCGVAGFKPTYGLVSRRGVRPLGFTLDHVGPLARTVRDAAISTRAMARLPEVSIPAEIRIGWPENFYLERVDPEVKAAIERVARGAESIGARIVRVRVPDVEALNAAARAILLAEASAAFAKYKDRREDFGSDVRALLDQGDLLPAPDYVNAQRLREQFVGEFRRLFEQIDLLLTPTIPITAPKIGQNTIRLDGEETDTRLLTTAFMRGINALGLPALSMPAGLASNRMPIGAQLIGRAGEDGLVLDFGARLEVTQPSLY